MESPKSELRDGMRIDWDIPIVMDDGLVLRADLFRPGVEGRHPVLLSYGPYAKGLAFQDGYPSAWQRMISEHPEVAAGSYRDMTHHGGILCTFWANWYDMQVKTVQYGLGERGPRSRLNDLAVCGDDTLSDKELYENRAEFGDEILSHPLDDAYHKARSPVWHRVKVPLLSAANWGGQGLHARGNFEGFLRAASKDKWLPVHGLEPSTTF